MSAITAPTARQRRYPKLKALRRPQIAFGVITLGLILLIALVAPLITTVSPNQLNILGRLTPHRALTRWGPMT